MRVERISLNQFSIFLTYDDLIERGFTKEDLKYQANIQEFFTDMMYEASDELGIELSGLLSVQVNLMQAQGMHICVTQNEDILDEDDHIVQMEFSLDESHELIFYVDDFETWIQIAPHLSSLNLEGGQIYFFDNRYYMILDHDELGHVDEENLIAIMSEFSYPSIMSSHRIKEYGKVIYDKAAIKQIMNVFY